MTQHNRIEVVELSGEAAAEVCNRSGYGCVRCGVTVYVFARLPVADEADWLAPATVLLCPNCRNLLKNHPLEDAQYSALLARPVMRDMHFNRRHLPHGPTAPDIVAGGPALLHNVSIPVVVGEEAPLMFSPPLHGLGALLISLSLSGADDRPEPLILANRWVAAQPGWTFRQHGSRYVVECDSSKSRCELEFSSPTRVTILHLLTRCSGHQIEIRPDWIEINGRRMTDCIRSGQLIGYRV